MHRPGDLQLRHHVNKQWTIRITLQVEAAITQQPHFLPLQRPEVEECITFKLAVPQPTTTTATTTTTTTTKSPPPPLPLPPSSPPPPPFPLRKE
ncbi:hypothetical protein E2C01_056040 [Portunus trituberculatus]|uniref:Uncharacterized protein n=1 Tax=Portunus trituberculatus TaxID=210409 RepID=A0A5B7GPA1_PORTR|nr:hypothetical protein [Portunus trituberculatus]